MLKGVLMDLSGTVHVEDVPVPGAAEAVQLLQERGIPFRFVTNTSRKTRAMLHHALSGMGFDFPAEHIFSAPLSVRRYLGRRGLRPFLLVHPDLLPEFEGLPRNDPDAVVVGFAQDAFTYRTLNDAFRLLKQGAPLIATGRTPYFQGSDGLQLDAGPFIAALEYAAQTEAVVLGKPSEEFFTDAAAELGLKPEECIMIGDDAASDIGGALAAGLTAILVRTGKYRAGDEEKISGDFSTADNVKAAVDKIVRVL